MNCPKILLTAVITLPLLAAAPLVVLTNQPEAEPATPLADHPAAKMVGQWRGTASAMARDGQWHEAVAIERARWNLAGTAILVEGLGYVEDGETREVQHDAFGLIEWDLESKAPVFHAHRAGGEFDRHALDRVDDSDDLRWSMSPAPGMTLRFTITLTENTWHEIGEMTRDNGESWTKFVEMELKRVGDR